MQLFEIQFAWFFKEGIQLDFENLVSIRSFESFWSKKPIIQNNTAH